MTTKQQSNKITKTENRKSKQKPKPKPKATDRRGGCLGQPAALKLEKEIMNINILYLGSVMVIDVFATDVYKKRKKKKKTGATRAKNEQKQFVLSHNFHIEPVLVFGNTQTQAPPQTPAASPYLLRPRQYFIVIPLRKIYGFWSAKHLRHNEVLYLFLMYRRVM